MDAGAAVRLAGTRAAASQEGEGEQRLSRSGGSFMATNLTRRPGRGKVHSTLSRREVVKVGFGALAAPAVLAAIPANAQSRVIRIGHVSPRTGPLAGFGEADPYILDAIQKVLDKGIT